MNYDIRNLSNSFKEIHSRYYIDTNGVIYTSMSRGTTKIMIDGEIIRVTSLRRKLLEELNNTNNQIIRLPNTKDYFLMNDGTILQRLKTHVNDKKEVTVSLIRTHGGNSRGNRYNVARLLAGTFIGDITDKEVHHIDNNRLNNSLDNLKIMTRDEHRGVGNFKLNHK